jgi:hypothetical protein
VSTARVSSFRVTFRVGRPKLRHQEPIQPVAWEEVGKGDDPVQNQRDLGAPQRDEGRHRESRDAQKSAACVGVDARLGVPGSIRRLPRAAHNQNALKATETATKVEP